MTQDDLDITVVLAKAVYHKQITLDKALESFEGLGIKLSCADIYIKQYAQLSEGKPLGRDIGANTLRTFISHIGLEKARPTIEKYLKKSTTERKQIRKLLED